MSPLSPPLLTNFCLADSSQYSLSPPPSYSTPLVIIKRRLRSLEWSDLTMKFGWNVEKAPLATFRMHSQVHRELRPLRSTRGCGQKFRTIILSPPFLPFRYLKVHLLNMQSTMNWTPIASRMRTRARLKELSSYYILRCMLVLANLTIHVIFVCTRNVRDNYTLSRKKRWNVCSISGHNFYRGMYSRSKLEAKFLIRAFKLKLHCLECFPMFVQEAIHLQWILSMRYVKNGEY